MKFGYNSNVRLGDTLYHVQTEDRGADHPFIDTTVYAQGRVLHRRTTSYADLLAAGAAGAGVIKQRVEQQHREIIEELRAGSLAIAAPAPAERQVVPQAEGIEVRLLNATSWLAAGAARLEIEVRSRGSQKPEVDVEVEATFDDALEPARFTAQTDSWGRAELSFPLPRFSPDGGALVIRAVSAAGEDEVRYRLKARPRVAAPETPST